MKKPYWILTVSVFILLILSYITYIIYGTIKIEEDVIGTWESTQDSDYIVTFTNYGSVFEKYKELSTQGTWSVTRSVDSEDSEINYNKEYEYFLNTNIDSSLFLYAIEEVSEEEMTLLYIPRGTTLSFIRKEVLE
ncbi:MAG: hypothetical protein ACI9GH_000411 [Candidatus Paceibacteria bacterium]|jgi:hypothetical protein